MNPVILPFVAKTASRDHEQLLWCHHNMHNLSSL
jgi:hypothetical protein